MPDPANHGPAGSLSVLIIEDEPMIAFDIQKMLEEQGHHVMGPVGWVEQALSLLNGNMPDVAVLDLNLHGHPSTPVAERLRALHIPFIIASADASVVGGSAVFAGAPGIGKPIQQRFLLAALQRAFC